MPHMSDEAIHNIPDPDRYNPRDDSQHSPASAQPIQNV
jgi:hypothetical protein